MKKYFAVFLIVIALSLGGFYLYIQSGEVLNEQVPSIAENNTSSAAPMMIKPINRQGSFTEIDLIHKGTGQAIIFPDTADGPVLRLENFDVTRGPDLYVYLSKNENITSADQLGDFHSLGALKSSKGNQNYQLPGNHNEYKSVVIWCKAFGALFSSATLQP